MKYEFKLQCPKCSFFMVKAGKHITVKSKRQKWKCQNCGSVRLGEEL